MGLGDVSGTTVGPKISLVAPPAHGGTISTRTFIPVRVHESIGVLGAVSVGTAIMVPGAVGADLAVLAAARGCPSSTRAAPSGRGRARRLGDAAEGHPAPASSGPPASSSTARVFRAKPLRVAGASRPGVEMRLKTAPWLSATIAIRPYGLSVAGRTTWPPWLVARSTALSVSEVPK